MCRLLGFWADEPSSLVALIGKAGLEEFSELSHQHQDGWGLAFLDENGTIVQHRSILPAYQDPDFPALAGKPARAALWHFRWASPGMAVNWANTHPFVMRGTAFAHNGEVASDVINLAGGSLREGIEGTTDSERLYRSLLGECERAGDVIEGMRGLLNHVRGSFHYSGLNMMLLTSSQLLAVCQYDPAAPMLENDPQYYDLHYNAMEHVGVVASSGWETGDAWPRLANGSGIGRDFASRHTEVHHFV